MKSLLIKKMKTELKGCEDLFSENCMFNRTCKKKGTEGCNPYCYPFVVLHGQKGDGGFWRTTGVPTKYKKCLAGNLPIGNENPEHYRFILNFIQKIGSLVEEKGVGLFIYSIPNKENQFGTGTGKTTTAITLLNEYVLESVRKHLKGEVELKNNPALFVKGSELQNKYNAQFRGSAEAQKEASDSFYRMKNRMKHVPLLVIDDIAIRGITEAFENELYEVIDYRATEGKSTIYTSNLPLSEVSAIMGQRIASRIDGMTIPLAFKGQDHRKGGLF